MTAVQQPIFYKTVQVARADPSKMFQFTFKKEDESSDCEDEEKVDPESYFSHVLVIKENSREEMTGFLHYHIAPPSGAIELN